MKAAHVETETYAVRDGEWRLLDCAPAWEGNWTCDGFVCFAWEGQEDRRILVAVNYAPNQGQCYVWMAFEDLRGGHGRFDLPVT